MYTIKLAMKKSLRQVYVSLRNFKFLLEILLSADIWPDAHN